MSLRTLASVSLFTVKFSGDVLKRHWLSSRLTKHIHMYMTLSWNQVPESCPHSPQRVTIHLLSISKILTKYCRQSLSIWLTMQVNMYLHIYVNILFTWSLWHYGRMSDRSAQRHLAAMTPGPMYMYIYMKTQWLLSHEGSAKDIRHLCKILKNFIAYIDISYTYILQPKIFILPMRLLYGQTCK